MKHPTIGYYPFLDGLRAVAVLGVLFFHFSLFRDGPGFLTGGYVGVDVFFVLSGFLITGLIATGIEQKTFTFADFYERRCRRILPALFIVCALSILAAWFLLMPHEFRNFSKSVKGAALFYSNMIFARTNGYFDAPLSTMPLLHTWSLAVEEQFYLFFPPIAYGLYKVTKGRRAAVNAALGLLFSASLVFNIACISINPDKTFYILPTRAWELLAGGLVFLVLRPMALRRPAAEALAVIGALCIGFSYLAYDRNTHFPGWAAIVPCAGAALLIWSNLQNVTAVGRVLSARPLVLIGLISYGLYLYHWPVLVFSRYYLDRALNGPEVLGAVVTTALLSVLSYRLVEMPIRSRAILKSRKWVFLLSLAGIVALVAMAMAGARSGGFPNRFSGPVLDYAAGSRDGADWERRMPPFADLDEKTALRIGAPGDARPTFLLWGDSHAEALAPAIEAKAKALGITGLYVEYSGCLPLMGVARLDHSPKNAPCQHVGERVLSLLAHYRIDTVILAGRWDDVYGWESGSIEMGRPEAVIAYTPEGGTQMTGGPAFAPAFRDTIEQLRSRHLRVWVIEQVPPQLIDIPTGLAKATYFGRDLKALERPYQDIAARRQRNTDVFAAFRDRKGVSFIDPADRFCPGKTACLVEDDGHALYRDSNHLSVYGALWGQAMFDPVFRKRQPIP